MKHPLLFAALLGLAACTSSTPAGTLAKPVALAAPALTLVERDQVAIRAALRERLDNPASYVPGELVADGTLTKGELKSLSTGHPYHGADADELGARRYQHSYRATNAYGALVRQDVTAFVYATGSVDFL